MYSGDVPAILSARKTYSFSEESNPALTLVTLNFNASLFRLPPTGSSFVSSCPAFYVLYMFPRSSPLQLFSFLFFFISLWYPANSVRRSMWNWIYILMQLDSECVNKRTMPRALWLMQIHGIDYSFREVLGFVGTVYAFVFCFLIYRVINEMKHHS